MIDFEKTPSFSTFLSSLQDAELIKVSTENTISIKNREGFLEFGFGLYLLWLHFHKRLRYPLLYFTKLDSEHTLFLVTPYEDSSYLVRPKGYSPGQLYVDDLEKCLLTKPQNCPFCYLRNSLVFNLSFFAQTGAFKGFLTDSFLKKIQRDFPKKDVDCKKCKPKHLQWIRDKIIEDDKIGVCLGGYPALLRVSPKIFKVIFTEPLAPNQLRQDAIKFFDYFLAVYFAEKFGSSKYTSNSSTTSPFISFEIDVAILVEKGPIQNLLVVETTSHYHENDKLKNKLLNYSALSKGDYGKFLFLYVTLAQEASVKFGRDIKKLGPDNRDTGTFSSLMSNKDFVHISLPHDFKDIDTFLQKDWWDKTFLRKSFDYVIGAIEENSKILSIP